MVEPPPFMADNLIGRGRASSHSGQHTETRSKEALCVETFFCWFLYRGLRPELMSTLHQLIEQHWQQPKKWLRPWLRPLSSLYGVIQARRYAAYRDGRLKSERLAVPVVVVGNIHVGGVGKTPVTAALVKGLQARGISVGIISRGYGRRETGVHVLGAASRAEEAGDEPLLLYRQTAAPTAVGAKRVEAGRALLAAHPEIEVLVADDGLQHYALVRDVEIAVFPAADVGRRDLALLPDGGLREPFGRLQDVDAVVVSGMAAGETAAADFFPVQAVFSASVQTGLPYRLGQAQQVLQMEALRGKRVAAVAGIARPERFFRSLAQLGIELAQTVVLPDHAAIQIENLPQADYIIITEKDAVKFSDGLHLAHVWVLPMCAVIEPDLADFVCRRLGR